MTALPPCRCICHATGDPEPVGECCQYVHDGEQWMAKPETCICHSGSVCGPACANRHHGGCPYDRPSLQRLLSGADLPEDERDAYRIARAGRLGVNLDNPDDNEPCTYCGSFDHLAAIAADCPQSIGNFQSPWDDDLEPDDSDDDGGQADAAERLFLNGEGTLGGGRYLEPNE